MKSLEFADLVTHRNREGSIGVISRPVKGDSCWVQWTTPVGGLAIGPEELCDSSDLTLTVCPECQEYECCCGIGR